MSKKECEWSQQEDGDDYEDMIWSTSCGTEFQFIDGTPKDNEMNYCCYCGGKLIVKGHGE